MNLQTFATLAGANKPSDNTMKYLIFAGLGVFFWFQFKGKIMSFFEPKLTEKEINNVSNNGVSTGSSVDARWLKAQTLANSIHTAANGIGTDDAVLRSICTTLENDLPLLRLVNKAFGTREITWAVPYVVEVRGDLRTILQEELSGDDWTRWRKILDKI